MTHKEIMFHKARCKGAYSGCVVCSLSLALDSLNDSRSWISQALSHGAATIGTLKGVRRELQHEGDTLKACLASAHKSWLAGLRQQEVPA